uniref:Os01g0778800 protein n=1 Tax=Hydatigena taeniaeformis TaxID=6205 RepID=A0A0R3X4X6_HYDTA
LPPMLVARSAAAVDSAEGESSDESCRPQDLRIRRSPIDCVLPGSVAAPPPPLPPPTANPRTTPPNSSLIAATSSAAYLHQDVSRSERAYTLALRYASNTRIHSHIGTTNTPRVCIPSKDCCNGGGGGGDACHPALVRFIVDAAAAAAAASVAVVLPWHRSYHTPSSALLTGIVTSPRNCNFFEMLLGWEVLSSPKLVLMSLTVTESRHQLPWIIVI